VATKQATQTETHVRFNSLVDQYLDARKDEWRPGSLRQVRLHLLRYAKPLHKLPIGAVSQQIVAKLLNDVAKLNGAVTSNRLRASLATFTSWVIQQGIRLPEGNVSSAIKPRKEKSRDRILSDAEIRTIWRHLDDTDHSAIVKLLLLTGQREAEIGSLRWSEVQDDLITLPGERTKNGRAHIVPLGGAALAILNPLRIADRDRVFGRSGDKLGFRGWGISKARLDQRIYR
jgi:integrase